MRTRLFFEATVQLQSHLRLHGILSVSDLQPICTQLPTQLHDGGHETFAYADVRRVGIGLRGSRNRFQPGVHLVLIDTS